MNENKKNYIESINEIKVGDNMKKETLKKIKEKRNFSGFYKFASIAAVLLIIFSATWYFGRGNINKNKNNTEETVVGIEDGVLPKVESFEKLYEILKLSESRNTNYLGYSTDSVVKTTSAVTETASVSEQSATRHRSNNRLF